MSTPSLPPKSLPASPAIPLTPELRAAYEALYSKYEAAIEDTNDAGLEETLLASQSEVETVLDDDARYRLHANTALYESLLKQVDTANLDLTKLKAQILAVSSDISEFSDILAAIDGVLSLLPVA